MKRFISVFILLFVGFGVANAKSKLLISLNEGCTIYQCDYSYDLDRFIKEEKIYSQPTSYLLRSFDENHSFAPIFSSKYYVYVYETSSGKTDWRIIRYNPDIGIEIMLNKVMCSIWDGYEEAKTSNTERTEYWNSKPKDIIPVYCEVSDFHYIEPRHKVTAVANSSFIHDIITEAGGTNIFDDIDEAYVYAGEDLVIERAPEIIILLKSGNITLEDIKNRKGWENIPAVKNNRIYVINDVPQSFFDIVQSTMTKQIQEAIKEYKK